MVQNIYHVFTSEERFFAAKLWMFESFCSMIKITDIIFGVTTRNFNCLFRIVKNPLESIQMINVFFFFSNVEIILTA